MDFWQYVWHLFTTPLQITATVALFLTIILGIIAWRKPELERKTRQLLWIVPLSLFILLTPVALIKTSYDIYKETIHEREQNRPMIVIEPERTEKNINEEKQIITIFVEFNVSNIGNSSAYNTRSRLCTAPLDVPQDIDAYADIYETNPLFPGKQKRFDYEYTMPCESDNGNYIVPSDIILIYTDIRYSDAPSNGIWYEQPYWFAFKLKSGRIISALPEWIETFKPFVDKHYAGSQ